MPPPLMPAVYACGPPASTPATTSSTKYGLYDFIPLYTMLEIRRALSWTLSG